jgi:hypothetical protein
LITEVASNQLHYVYLVIYQYNAVSNYSTDDLFSRIHSTDDLKKETTPHGYPKPASYTNTRDTMTQNMGNNIGTLNLGTTDTWPRTAERITHDS